MNVFDKKVVDSIAVSLITVTVGLMVLVLGATKNLEAQTVETVACVADTNLYTFVPVPKIDYILSKKYHNTTFGMKASDIKSTDREVVCPITEFYCTMRYILNDKEEVCAVEMTYTEVNMFTLAVEVLQKLEKEYGSDKINLHKDTDSNRIVITLKYTKLVIDDSGECPTLTVIRL